MKTRLTFAPWHRKTQLYPTALQHCNSSQFQIISSSDSNIPYGWVGGTGSMPMALMYYKDVTNYQFAIATTILAIYQYTITQISLGNFIFA